MRYIVTLRRTRTEVAYLTVEADSEEEAREEALAEARDADWGPEDVRDPHGSDEIEVDDVTSDYAEDGYEREED